MSLKILIVHNSYQRPGGEEAVVAAETTLLTTRGHSVIQYTAHNDAIKEMTALGVGVRTIWNQGAFRALRQLIHDERPDVIHVHNTVPLISPAVYYAATACRVPVVQTVHNYRLGCPNGLCFRNQRFCTECLGRVVAWPGVRYGCYRNSRVATAAVAAMLSTHRLIGTWRNRVTLYIAPTEFSRLLLVKAGVAPTRIVVKPHFVDPDPGMGQRRGPYGLFVGRLSSEKGVSVLLEAWSRIGEEIPLQIIGDGPLGAAVTAAASAGEGIRWRGQLDPAAVAAVLREAAFLIFPSDAPETFGRVIVEAFATGTPVVVAGHGAAAELVRNGETGVHFRPGDPADLAAKVRDISGSDDARLRMGRAARAQFEARYTAAANYEALLKIYERVLSGSGPHGHLPSES
jgi:glycosyltransferase involved in cell wall biosynthesis